MDKLIFSVLTFSVYGSFSIISLILIFSVDTYKRIDEILCSNIFFSGSSNPLDINVRLDNFLLENNKTVGVILFLLSLIDMKLALDFLSIF